MGKTNSRGVSSLKIPIDQIVISFDVHVVDADIPILVSLADLDKNSLVYDNISGQLIHKPTGFTAQVVRKFGHPMIV